MTPIHIILNPAAGRGRGAKLHPQLQALLATECPGSEIHLTGRRGHAQAIAAQLKNSSGIIAAAGGDGTIHEVVNGMLGGNCRLGLIPIGTGNDFVRMFNLPKALPEVVRQITRGAAITIDLGRANDTVFMNGMGIGFDADVVVESQKIRFLDGFALYLTAVLRKVVSYENRDIAYATDGQRSQRKVFLLSIGNGQFLGGGFRLFPRANLTDGLLDVCMLHALNRIEIFKHLPKAIYGRHLGLSQVEYFNVQKIVIDCPDGIPGQVDGEMLGTALQHLEIEVLPKALQVIAEPLASADISN